MSELAKAICAVMAAVRYVPETGKNQFHRYSYASDEDLLTVLQPAMAANGLALVPQRTELRTVEHSPDAKGKPQWRTELVVTYRLLHTSGESTEVQSPGCGIDGEDKGAYKAMTGALKYALRHLFLVPTGQDPERAEAPAPAPAGRQEPTVRPAEPETNRSGRAGPTSTTEKREHHPSWSASQAWFCAQLKDFGCTYAVLASWCTANGKPRPSEVDSEARGRMLAWAQSNQGREALGLRPIVGGGQ